MKKTTKRILAPIGLVLAGTLLAACGTDDDGNDNSDAATFNDADITFAQGMIPHHEQAVEMAQQATDQAESTEVKDLAAKIEEAQAPEIEQLTAWLEEWDADVPSTGMDHGDMGHGDAESGMSGMMTEEDMDKLEGTNGSAFDQMFLEMMIEHHRGAVSMAKTEVADGKNADAIDMAEEIITTQNDEIEQMERLLGS
ncbi:DUF305 domain-containing protein [Nocardioides pacificus]